jgi:hypothetical protein
VYSAKCLQGVRGSWMSRRDDGRRQGSEPYTQPPKGEACHLLDQESRHRLAEAWWKGWERCQKVNYRKSKNAVT